MADFPSLVPQTRTYTPGTYAVLRAGTLSGGDFAVRKTNAVTDYRLSLTFVSADLTQSDSIFFHYAIQNRFQPFDLPASVISNSGFSFPSGYQWIYAASPEVTFSPGNVQVTVELELVAPYGI
jgi:hypothetical protein